MNNKLIAIIMTLVVGIILTGSVLVPVVNDARTITSTETNYENESIYFTMADASDTVTIALSSGTLTLNGETVTPVYNSNVILSDAFSVDQFQYQGNWLTRVWYQNSTELSYPSAFSLTFADGTVTGSITSGGNTDTFETAYTYLYYADADGKYTQMSGQNNIDAYVNDPNQLILSGLYYTGDNKTTYSYINGELTLEEPYTGSVALTKEKVGLDTWHITGITVTVGDESFTPFRYIVPTEITGHTETPASSLVSVIPVLVIVSLVVAAIGMVVVVRGVGVVVIVSIIGLVVVAINSYTKN